MGSTGQASKLRDAFGRSGLDLRIFVKDVRDRQGRKRPLNVRPWSTVKDVKDKLQQLLLVPPSAQRLFLGGPLLIHGRELPNHWTLHDAGVYRSGETLLFDIRDGGQGGGLPMSYETLASSSSSGQPVTPSASSASLSCLDSSSMAPHSGLSRHSSDICVSASMTDRTPRPMWDIVRWCRRGLQLGFKPEFVLDGSGGTYFLHDSRKKRIGVFKPSDEEPYAENNPRGYVDTANNGPDFLFLCDEVEEGMSLREGVKPGEACLREVGAYLLDHGGFSGVPMTTLAEARHPAFHVSGTRLKVSEGGASIGPHSISPVSGGLMMSPHLGSSGDLGMSLTRSMMSPTPSQSLKDKIGSLQEYVHAECTMDDLSPSKISVDEVHKIAILDIRIMNADRNVANLLVRRRTDDRLELVPIDHGFCLRSACDVSWFDWCWLDWPQLKKPLSRRSRDYVLGLNIEEDVRILEERLKIPTKALDIFRASSMLLQAGVKAGLSLYDIALMCCRHDDAGEVPSRLESLTAQAVELATTAVENGRWHHSAASRALEDQLTREKSALQRPLVSGSPSSIPKCKSHAVLSSSSFEEGTSSNPQELSPPGSTQTSGSESSSDSGDVDGDEECEEWAAAVIADVSLIAPALDYRNRSVSDASGSSNGDDDDSSSRLSSSPKGFWLVAPGSPSLLNSTPLDWSPTPSPRNSVSADELLAGGDDSLVVPGVDTTAPAVPEGCGDFIVADTPPPPLPRLAEVAQSAMPSMARKPLKHQGIVRSQSYSAFSFQSISTKNLVASMGADTENNREYVRKFVDLLIRRETMAAANRSARS